MSYRVITTSNMELIRLLDREIFPSDDPVAVDGAKWWVAIRDGQPVAFGGVKVKDGFAFLVRAGVVRAHRGNRLQRRLIQAREKYAKAANAKCICTYTVIDNPESVNTLIGMGYRQYNPEWAWEGRKVLYWRKEL